MGKRVAGTFNCTGAALYLGIGFVPDWVKVQSFEDTVDAQIKWNKHMTRSADYPEGIYKITGTTYRQTGDLGFGAGIAPYYGGDKMTAASTVYLVRDDSNYVTSDTYGTINAWTLDTAATPTGHFNLEADTNYVGEGSTVIIDGKEYGITAMTSNGESDDEVTLNAAAPSGVITYIGRMYDYVGAAIYDVIPAGFKISDTTYFNADSGEMAWFEAGTYDN